MSTVLPTEDRIERNHFAVTVRDNVHFIAKQICSELGGTWEPSIAVGKSPDDPDVLRVNVLFKNAGGDELMSDDLLFPWAKWRIDETVQLREYARKFAKLKLTSVIVRVLNEKRTNREGSRSRDTD